MVLRKRLHVLEVLSQTELMHDRHHDPGVSSSHCVLTNEL